MERNVSVVRLIVATRSSGPPASGKIIKEMPGSVASGTPYINKYCSRMSFCGNDLHLTLVNISVHKIVQFYKTEFIKIGNLRLF